MTATILAARCYRPGRPRDVVVESIPVPEAGPGQALIEVAAASVNFSDTLIVAGGYQVRPELPFTPGSEFAGVVRSVGPDVDGFAPGDEVMGSSMVGAFAEVVVAPVASLSQVPSGVDLRDAAAFRVAHGTAYHALCNLAHTRPGEWVVVLGAAGGVGSASVELAKVLGARVLAAASSREKLAACRELGADVTVDYTSEHLKLRIREVTGGGADVVVDPVGGRWSEPALRAMRWSGRFICVGFASGEIPRIPLNLLLLKGVWVTGLEKRTYPEHDPEGEARSRRELLEWLAAGRLRPRIASAHPLAHTAEALAEVAERRATGKVMIEVSR